MDFVMASYPFEANPMICIWGSAISFFEISLQEELLESTTSRRMTSFMFIILPIGNVHMLPSKKLCSKNVDVKNAESHTMPYAI